MLYFVSIGTVNAVEPLKKEWTVDGVKREALIYAPADAKTTASPVVFAFHGHGGNMNQAAKKFNFQKLWPEAIVVYMQGLDTPARSPTRKASGPDAKDIRRSERPRLEVFRRGAGNAQAGLQGRCEADLCHGAFQRRRFHLLALGAAAMSLPRSRRVPRRPGQILGRTSSRFRCSTWPARPIRWSASPGRAHDRRSSQAQRLRRRRTVGRALHALSLEDRHARRDLYPFRRPHLPDDVLPVIVKFFKQHTKP